MIFVPSVALGVSRFLFFIVVLCWVSSALIFGIVGEVFAQTTKESTTSKEEDSIIDETDIEEDDQNKKNSKGRSKSAFSNTKSDQTNIDFEETLLEGKMKAPSGTFLQGRKEQRKNQMVQLRPHFRRELKKSKGGARQLTD